MFSLIITIVSIALVVALVAATMYYGGDVLGKGRDSANAAAFVTGGQQIAGALQLYNSLEGADYTGATTADLITDKYLQSDPVTVSTSAWAIDTTNKRVTIEGVPAAICAAINERAGHAVAGPAAGAGLYGCVVADTEFYINY